MIAPPPMPKRPARMPTRIPAPAIQSASQTISPVAARTDVSSLGQPLAPELDWRPLARVISVLPVLVRLATRESLPLVPASEWAWGLWAILSEIH